jgi:N utilization substance protein A
VQSIVRELGGERIDIVPWSQDLSVFVARALSPARVMDVKVHEEEKRMHVIVADDQLSLAIGKGGQNARLAAKLSGWKIDLTSKSEEKKRQEHEQSSRIEIEKLDLGEATTERLIGAGLETVQELAAATPESLLEIPGIGEKTAEKLLATALAYLEAHPPESAPAELEFLPESSESTDEATPVEEAAEEDPKVAAVVAASDEPEAGAPAPDTASSEQPATEEEHRD